MKITWATIVAILCICITAGFYFYAGGNSSPQGKYVVFNPPLDDVQKAVVQQQMDQQLAKKNGATKVSSTQLVYDNGAVVVTFPPPGVVSEILTSCDFGYFCVWEHNDYVGLKVALAVVPAGVINLPVYMTRQVSSWKYNNARYKTLVYGLDEANGAGKIMTATLKEIGIGDECCPFGADEKAQGWTEIYELRMLGAQTDNIVSVRFSPMFGTAVR